MSQNSYTINVPSNATLTISPANNATGIATGVVDVTGVVNATGVANAVYLNPSYQQTQTSQAVNLGNYQLTSQGALYYDPSLSPTTGGSLTIGGYPGAYPYTTSYPYIQGPGEPSYGGLTGGLSGSLSLSNNWNTYYPVTDELVAAAINGQNYDALTNMGNTAMSVNRRLYNKIQRAVLDSENWGVIFNFITRTSNIDLKHLTKQMLKAFQESSEDNKEQKLAEYIGPFLYRFNIGEYVRFGIAKSSHKLLEPLVMYITFGIFHPYSNTYNSANNIYNYTNYTINSANYTNGTQMHAGLNHTEKTFRKTYGAKYQDFEKIMLTTENENLLYTLFCAPNQFSKQNIFRRVRQLGKTEMAQKMINESKEKWAESLRNMK